MTAPTAADRKTLGAVRTIAAGLVTGVPAEVVASAAAAFAHHKHCRAVAAVKTHQTVGQSSHCVAAAEELETRYCCQYR